MLTFRQLFDTASSTYTYLLGHQGQAVLIDPVFEHERRDLALVRELGLTLVAVLDTHVHADHVTAAWRLKQRTGCRIVQGAAGGAEGVDVPLAHGECIAFGGRHLQARATPGHTAGCMTYVLDDESMAFTGDALLIRGCGRTDFQQGSPEALFSSVREQILSLPPATLLYPGHDYRGINVTTVAEEQRFNPRLGGDANVADFTGYMRHLYLPHPKQMDVAVPANLRCGRPAGDDTPPAEPQWAPLALTFGGVWEIQPTALEERLGAAAGAHIQLLDLREASEAGDGLGRIRGARSLPMSKLVSGLATDIAHLDRTQPVVAVCRSGTRSAQATALLSRAGFAQVANLAGGMLRWRAEGLPVEGGA